MPCLCRDTVRQSTDILNILFIGIDYFSNRCSSDKNFWHRMLPKLAETLERIVVISFNYRKDRTETQLTPRQNIEIFNVRPSHAGIDLRSDPSTVHNPEKCHSHFKSPPQSPLEYLLSFVRIRPLVRRLVVERSITNVHCMDNFGPAMRLLKRWVAPIPVSVSAMGYYARGPLHDRYLRMCYHGLDAIVPFSQAYRQKLGELGLEEQRLHAIPWGIDTDSAPRPATLEDQKKLRKELGIEPECKLVLWTGFIQQIREKELDASYKIAQSLVQRRSDVQFAFALKPECYKLSYQDLEMPQIRMLSTSNETFLRLLQAADYLLSPITNTNSIVTPPLTWLESMVVGVPIVANRVPGVEAVVLSGENGFVARDVDAIPPLLDTALSLENQEQIRKSAREHVVAHYAISQSALGYLMLWQGLRK